jgi:hypothetical protein
MVLSNTVRHVIGIELDQNSVQSLALIQGGAEETHVFHISII